MSQRDRDLEHFTNILISTVDAIRYYLEVSSYDDCNTCGKTKCRYMPDPGQMVRINCPLWQSKAIDCKGCSLFEDGGEICDMCAQGIIDRNKAENLRR